MRDLPSDALAYVLLGASRSSVAAWLAVYSVIGLEILCKYVMDPNTKTIVFFGSDVKVSSVVSILLTVEGFVNLILCPLYGYLVNRSAYRTALLRVTLSMMPLSVLVLALILFGYGTMSAVVSFSIVLVFATLMTECQFISHQGYLPELFDDAPSRISLQSKQNALGFASQLLFIGLTIIVTYAADLTASPGDSISHKFYVSRVIPQVAAIISVVVWLAWAIPGMIMISSRRAPTEYPSVIKTIKLCWTDYSQLSLYYCSYCFYQSGANALIGLGVSYLSAEVGLTGFALQLQVMIVVASAVVGSLVTKTICDYSKNLKVALMIVLCWWAFFVILPVPLLLTGEDYELPNGNTARRPTSVANVAKYFTSIIWGIGIGAIFPINTAFTAEFVPGGVETAFYGVKTFSSKVFAWLPPLVYTVMNSAYGPRVAFIGLIPFPIIGAFIFCFFDIDKAHAQVKDTLHLRQSINIKAVEPSGSTVDSESVESNVVTVI